MLTLTVLYAWDDKEERELCVLMISSSLYYFVLVSFFYCCGKTMVGDKEEDLALDKILPEL